MLNIFSGIVRKLRQEEGLEKARRRIAEQEQRIEELEIQANARVNPADGCSV